MKQIILIIFGFFGILLSSVSVAAQRPPVAYDFAVDGVYFKVATDDPSHCVLVGCEEDIVDLIVPQEVTYEAETYKVTEIGRKAFDSHKSLGSVTLPESVTVIGDRAFICCTNLQSIYLPQSLEEIGESAFYDCGELISISIPDGIIEIKDATFYLCKKLKNVNLGNSIVKIGELAFCSSGIEEIALPETLLFIDTGAFDGSSLRKIYIPDSVRYMFSPFSLCGKLVEIRLPNTIYQLDSFFFNECYNLPSIAVPDSVRYINNMVFGYCRSLEDLTLGQSVEEISFNAFFRCKALKNVTCRSLTPPSFEGDFEEEVYAAATLYVPAEALEDYLAASPWNKFGTIEAIETGIGDVTVEGDDVEEPMYDLMGRRVVNPNPGQIYIRNGKKLVLH